MIVILQIYTRETTPEADRLAAEIGFSPDSANIARGFELGLYKAVATFDSDNLEEAWRDTQNGVNVDSWSRDHNPKIDVLGSGHITSNGRQYGYKSSSVGDVFVVNGAPHVVAKIGFDPLETPLPDQIPVIGGGIIAIEPTGAVSLHA